MDLDFGVDEIDETDVLALVKELVERPILPDACESLGINHYDVRMLMRRNPKINDAIEVAIQVGAEQIEAHAFRRAMGEYKSIQMHGGRPITQVNPETGETEYFYEIQQSDRILQMMLQAFLPEKYGNKAEIKHTAGTGVLMVPAVDGAKIFEEMLADASRAAQAEMEDFDRGEASLDAATWKPSSILKH